jgi:hypothetical protein
LKRFFQVLSEVEKAEEQMRQKELVAIDLDKAWTIINPTNKNMVTLEDVSSLLKFS